MRDVAEALEAVKDLSEEQTPPWEPEWVVEMQCWRRSDQMTKTGVSVARSESLGRVDALVEEEGANPDAAVEVARERTSLLAREAPEEGSLAAASAGRDFCLFCESKDLQEKEAKEKRYEAPDEPLEAPGEAAAADAEPAGDVGASLEPVSVVEELLEGVDACLEEEEMEAPLPRRRRRS